MTPIEAMQTIRTVCLMQWGNATLAHPSPWSDELEEMKHCFFCGKPVAPWETQAGARGECKDCGAH